MAIGTTQFDRVPTQFSRRVSSSARFTLCITFPFRHRSIFVPSEWSLFTQSEVFIPPSRTARDSRPAIISTKYAAHCHGMRFPLFVNYENFGDDRMTVNFKMRNKKNET